MNQRNSFKPFSIIACLACCSSASVAQTNYFVAPWGNDASSGSNAAPFRTIQKGIDAAAGGSVVEIAAGTYWEQPIIAPGSGHGPAAGLTIRGQFKGAVSVKRPPGPRPMNPLFVDSDGVVCDPVLWVVSALNVVIENIDFDGGDEGPSSVGWKSYGAVVTNSTGAIRHCRFSKFRTPNCPSCTDGDDLGVFGGGTVLSIENSEFYDAQSNCVYARNLANVSIIGCLFRGPGVDYPLRKTTGVALIQTNGASSVRDCVFENFWNNNAATGPSAGIYVDATVGSVSVENNRIRDCQWGVLCIASGAGNNIGGWTISGNTIASTPGGAGEQEGVYLLKLPGAPASGAFVVMNNIIEDRDAIGFRTDFGGGQVVGNTFRRNGGGASAMNARDEGDGTNVWTSNRFSDDDPAVPGYAVSGAGGEVDASPAPFPTDVFVSLSGSDANPGTSLAPFASVQKGIDSVGPEGVVYIASGVFIGSAIVDPLGAAGAGSHGPNARFSIRGNGRGTTILRRPPQPRVLFPSLVTSVGEQADPLLWVEGQGVGGTLTVEIRGVTFDGAGDDVPGAPEVGIGAMFIRSRGFIDSCEFVDFRGSTVGAQAFGGGLFVHAPGASVEALETRFTNNSLYGAEIRTGAEALFRECCFEGNTTPGIPRKSVGVAAIGSGAVKAPECEFKNFRANGSPFGGSIGVYIDSPIAATSMTHGSFLDCDYTCYLIAYNAGSTLAGLAFIGNSVGHSMTGQPKVGIATQISPFSVSTSGYVVAGNIFTDCTDGYIDTVLSGGIIAGNEFRLSSPTAIPPSIVDRSAAGASWIGNYYFDLGINPTYRTQRKYTVAGPAGSTDDHPLFGEPRVEVGPLVGPGSLAIGVSGGTPNSVYFFAATFTPQPLGGPIGYWFGLSLPLSELFAEIQVGPPFIGVLDPSGRSTYVILPAGALPIGAVLFPSPLNGVVVVFDPSTIGGVTNSPVGAFTI